MKKDTAVIKDKLMGIADLNASAILGMNDKQLKSYTDSLSVTAGTFPVQKGELESALIAMDYAHVFQWMKTISSSLSLIHADTLFRECEKQINQYQDLENIRHEKLKAYIEYFMSTLDIFFTDIHDILEFFHLEEVEPQKDEPQPEKIKEKLLTITELNSGKIELMSDEQLYSYLEALNSFLNDFPLQENGLKSSAKIRHYVFVLQWMTSIEESLAKIHADELLEECRGQIAQCRDFNSIRHEKLEAFVNYFLSSLSMLSADINMLHLPKSKPAPAPVDTHEKKAENITKAEVISPGAGPDSKSMLIVNKMRLFMNNFKVALGDCEHEVIGITSSDGALNYLRTAKPDLFIIDEDLPGKDGYMLTIMIRKMGQMAPVIMTTSKLTKDKMVRFMGVGVADFIFKPITANDVQKKVTKHIDHT
jgi:CheY-like chemotaxis protein